MQVAAFFPDDVSKQGGNGLHLIAIIFPQLIAGLPVMVFQKNAVACKNQGRCGEGSKKTVRALTFPSARALDKRRRGDFCCLEGAKEL